MGINVLSGLLDEKLIKIISLFMKYPDRKFSMSEVSRFSGINGATTFRILNKIVKENLVRVTVVGKSRSYQLSQGERANSLSRLLKKTEEVNVLDIFCDRVKELPRVKTVLLDSKDANSAKLIIVGEYPSSERINKIRDDLYENKKFKISFVELTLKQYKDLRKFGTIPSGKRILFTRA
jgi:hypothetical protein